MLTEEQKDNLKPGDKLIFVRWGHVLNTLTGNVFTFSNWFESSDRWAKGKSYWQCKEMHDYGNHVHNYGINHVELFDPEVHKEYRLMNEDILDAERNDFIEKWGA